MAIAEDDIDDIHVKTPGHVFRFDLTAWGWIHLILGIMAILVGFRLFKRPCGPGSPASPSRACC
jgi:hypothetical protein